MTVSYLMLSRLLKLSSKERVWFMLLCCGSYPTLLFSLAMEQYIFAFFWIVLFLYNSKEGIEPDQLALTAAAGCVVTSAFLLPLIRKPGPWKQPVGWLKDMVSRAILFLLAMTALFRADLLLQFFSGASGLFTHLGGELSLVYKFQQYTNFAASCLLAPEALPVSDLWDAWWLTPVTGVHFVGLLILVLCVVSFLIHRKWYISCAAMGWIAVSFAVVCVFGWGAKENTMVLYSLYFSWAFAVLLFQLLKWVCGCLLKKPVLLPVFGAVLVCVLLACNLRGMSALLRFAAEIYPAIG